jgi:hypothetical protein
MATIALEELRHAELSWATNAWASSQLGEAGSARLHEIRVEALRHLEREMEANHPLKELVVRAGIPWREATRKLLQELAEVVQRPALA